MAKGAVVARVEDAAVRKALNRSRVGVGPAVRRAFTKAGGTLVSRMRQNLRGHNKIDRGDNGGLLGAIDFEVTDRRGQMQLTAGPGVGGDEFMVQAETIEHGRGAGKPMPPKGELLPWMARKGIPEEAEFPIRRKIAEEGLQGQPFPFIAPAFAEVGPIVDEAMDAIAASITADFGS